MGDETKTFRHQDDLLEGPLEKLVTFLEEESEARKATENLLRTLNQKFNSGAFSSSSSGLSDSDLQKLASKALKEVVGEAKKQKSRAEEYEGLTEEEIKVLEAGRLERLQLRAEEEKEFLQQRKAIKARSSFWSDSIKLTKQLATHFHSVGEQNIETMKKIEVAGKSQSGFFKTYVKRVTEEEALVEAMAEAGLESTGKSRIYDKESGVDYGVSIANEDLAEYLSENESDAAEMEYMKDGRSLSIDELKDEMKIVWEGLDKRLEENGQVAERQYDTFEEFFEATQDARFAAEEKYKREQTDKIDRQREQTALMESIKSMTGELWGNIGKGLGAAYKKGENPLNMAANWAIDKVAAAAWEAISGVIGWGVTALGAMISSAFTASITTIGLGATLTKIGAGISAAFTSIVGALGSFLTALWGMAVSAASAAWSFAVAAAPYVLVAAAIAGAGYLVYKDIEVFNEWRDAANEAEESWAAAERAEAAYLAEAKKNADTSAKKLKLMGVDVEDRVDKYLQGSLTSEEALSGLTPEAKLEFEKYMAERTKLLRGESSKGMQEISTEWQDRTVDYFSPDDDTLDGLTQTEWRKKEMEERGLTELVEKTNKGNALLQQLRKERQAKEKIANAPEVSLTSDMATPFIQTAAMEKLTMSERDEAFDAKSSALIEWMKTQKQFSDADREAAKKIAETESKRTNVGADEYEKMIKSIEKTIGKGLTDLSRSLAGQSTNIVIKGNESTDASPEYSNGRGM
jgi:predicted metal-dependent phosphoesterase TrpH